MVHAPREYPLFPYTTLFRSPRCASKSIPHRYRADGPGPARCVQPAPPHSKDRKSTRLNSSHVATSYAVFCFKKKKISSPVGFSFISVRSAQRKDDQSTSVES